MVEHLADEAISIGRYVLSGGELPAMVVADAVLRKLPGALGDAESAVEESFTEALEGAPEYPHYTRPGDLPRLGGPGDPALGRPRAVSGVAAGASRGEPRIAAQNRWRISATIAARAADGTRTFRARACFLRRLRIAITTRTS